MGAHERDELRLRAERPQRRSPRDVLSPSVLDLLQPAGRPAGHRPNDPRGTPLPAPARLLGVGLLEVTAPGPPVPPGHPGPAAGAAVACFVAPPRRASGSRLRLPRSV